MVLAGRSIHHGRMPTSSPFKRLGPPTKRFGAVDALLVVGLVMAIPMTLVLLALAALTVNPCGAFGDACDSAGQSSPQAAAFFIWAVRSALVIPTCIVSLIGRAYWRFYCRVMAS
jgi:hypothetical protein